MKLLHLIKSDFAEILDFFINRPDMPDVISRKLAEPALKRLGHKDARFRAAALDLSDLLSSDLVEVGLGKCRFAKNFHSKPHRRNQVVGGCSDGYGDTR